MASGIARRPLSKRKTNAECLESTSAEFICGFSIKQSIYSGILARATVEYIAEIGTSLEAYS